MLPLDEENRAERIKEFEAQFHFALQMVDTGAEVVNAIASIRPRRMTMTTKAVIAGLAVRGLRQYRGIIALAEWGLVEDMEILSRSLYENLLALRFIARPAKRFAACSSELRSSRSKLPRIPRRYRAIDFRAVLYASSFFATVEKKIAAAKQLRGMKRLLSNANTQANDTIAADARQYLGADWLAAQKRFGGYSGLRIHLLAEQCGLATMHLSIYGIMSTRTHANDGLAYMEKDGSTWVVPIAGNEAKLAVNMSLAAEIFAILLLDLDRLFRLQLSARCREVLRPFHNR